MIGVDMGMGVTGHRLKRLILIYRVVQVFLFGLFLYMAWHFQQLFRTKGMPHVFVNSLIGALVVQLLLFYPIRKLAAHDAGREAASQSPDLSPQDRQNLRQQRIFADLVKASVFLAFAVFILIAPPATFILSTAFFCFLLTVLTYAQCFNFALSRLMRQKPGPVGSKTIR
jgi:hypothetical protein